MPQSPPPRQIALIGTLILALSAALRLLLWWQLGGEPQWLPDSSSYIEPARSLLKHGLFLNAGGGPDTVRTPGYPLFIALNTFLGWGLIGVVLLQHLLALGMALLVAGWSAPRFGNGVALATGALASLNFLLCLYPNFLLSEILFASLTTGAILALGCAFEAPSSALRPVIVAAILSSGAALVRPIGVYFFLPACLALLLCLPGRRVAPTLAFLVVFALAPSAWMARNHTLTGQFTLSDIAGVNLLCYQAAGTLAIKDGGEYAVAHERIRNRLLADAQRQFAEQPWPEPHRSLNSIYMETAMGILRDNPGPFVRHLLRNITATLLGNGSAHLARLVGIDPGTARMTAAASALPALLLALYGLFLMTARNPRFALLAFLTVAYFIGITALGGVGGSRFRIPLEPLLCLLQALALTNLGKRFLLRREPLR
ncbi:MAG: hypothetical protein V3571_04510 [Pseudodesulfovibrio sp.]